MYRNVAVQFAFVISKVGAYVSFRLEIDLQAYSLPVLFSIASRVVPNCPRPNTFPRV